jgi:hypothetical protein
MSTKPIQSKQIVERFRASQEAPCQTPGDTVPSERTLGIAQHPLHVAPDDEDILIIPEVATNLRCSKAHAYNLINGAVPGVPRLPAMPMGRRKVVRRGSLNQWKRDLEQGGRGSGILPPSPEVDAVDALERKCHA